MILLFLNSFCGFFFQSLIIKAACLRMQSDYLGSTLVLSFLYLGFSSGCRISKNKTFRDQERALLFFASSIPLLMLQIGSLIEMTPAILVTFKAKMESMGAGEDALTVYVMLGLGLVFLVGLWSGYEIVCLYNVIAQKKTKLVIALSYFGALFAGLLASFYSFHQDHLLRDLCCMTILYYGTGIWFLIRFRQPVLIRIAAGAFLIGSSLYAWNIFSRTSEMKDLSRGVLYGRTTAGDWNQSHDPMTETVVSPYQRLDIARFRKPTPYFQLFLNEDFQFDSVDHGFYHQTFVKGAMHFRAADMNPKKILVLGGGDGLLAAEVFRVLGESVEITMVELDPQVVQTALEKWPQLLNGVFSKNIHVIYDDAFRFLRHHPEKYDAVFMDFPDPKSFDTSKLYSVEMYQMVRKVLNENGFITLDFPFANSQVTLVSTLDAAGFQNETFFGQGQKFFYADLRKGRTDLAELASHSPIPVYSPVTPAPDAVNSIFRPTLPGSL